MTTTRNTVQRALVLDAVRSMDCHPTSAEVYERVRRQHPSISRATVYRNLGVLAARGDIIRVEVAGGADRYDFRLSPHGHALCRRCGGVFDVEVAGGLDPASSVSDAHGFRIESCEIMFEGLCPTCQNAEDA